MQPRIKLVILISASVSVLLFIGLVIVQREPAGKAADTAPTINLDHMAPALTIQTDNTITTIAVRKAEGYIYKAQAEHAAAAKEFLTVNPTYAGSGGKRLLPENIVQNSALTRTEIDANNPTAAKLMPDASGEHYFFTQSLQGIAVYGSHLQVHLRNSNEIFDVNSKLLTDTTVPAAKLSNDDAITAAKTAAALESGESDFTVVLGQRYIFNKRLLGLATSDTNHLVVSADVKGRSDLAVMYLVDLTSGAVLYSQPINVDARAREVLSSAGCDLNNLSSCSVLRTETGLALGDADSDNAFDIVGKVYDYYKNTYGRDSFDNQGTKIPIIPHFPKTNKNNIICPNAAWLPRNGFPESGMMMCDGMVAADVIAHEMTHGVTEFSADLLRIAESGALNESISDIFATAIDPNWLLGESTVLGTVRRFDDPTLIINPITKQSFPDRLSASGVFCPQPTPGALLCNTKNDVCGIHGNSTIMSKAFYLMTDGGNFNGYTITGLGKDKTHPIIYQTLTNYLTPTSNFCDMYKSVNKACQDLFPNSPDCDSVDQAMKAVELDQQHANTILPPVCVQGVPGMIACVTALPQATPTPIPTLIPSPSLTPTNIPPPPNNKPATSPVTGNCTGAQAEIPTLISPKGVVKKGSVVFSWKTSKVQNGYYFRVLFNRDPAHQLNPEVIMDNWGDNKVTEGQLTKNGQHVELPVGKHSWWVHSLCDGKLTAAKGGEFTVVDSTAAVQKSGSSKSVNSAQPQPTITAIVLPSRGRSQGQGSIDFVK